MKILKMPSLTGFNLRFTPTWRMSVLALVSVLLFMRLGIWQMDRAAEKNHMLETHSSFETRTPIDWLSGSSLPAQYEHINVQGLFISQVFLLDNQHHEHKFGYHVLSPLMLSDNTLVLVDRGWIEGEPSRHHFPVIDLPKERISIKGQVYYPSGKNWLLGQFLEQKQENLAVIELVDIKKISQFLHKSVYPFIIRLNYKEAHGYVREWAVVAMNPQRHYGYAMQWFAISFVVFILFIALNIKKKT